MHGKKSLMECRLVDMLLFIQKILKNLLAVAFLAAIAWSTGHHQVSLSLGSITSRLPKGEFEQGGHWTRTRTQHVLNNSCSSF